MVSENQKFRKLIKRYRKHFKLSQGDVAEFMNIKQNTYSAMETGRADIDLDKADTIARVYGLRHFQMLDPKQKTPKIESLPPRTKKRVLERKAEGKKLRNDELELPKQVMEVFKSGKLAEKFTSSDIWGLLPNNIKSQIKSTRITDLFSKGELKDKIEYTGKKRGREKVYRLR